MHCMSGEEHTPMTKTNYIRKNRLHSHVWINKDMDDYMKIRAACGTKLHSGQVLGLNPNTFQVNRVNDGSNIYVPTLLFQIGAHPPTCKRCFKEFYENMPVPIVPGVFPRIKPFYYNDITLIL